MDCHTHPGVAATGACTGCAEPFCPQCLVDIRGVRYCGSCKGMAIPATAAVPVRRPCVEANEALKYALLGIVCFGIILEPLAISKALKARAQIRANPALSGEGKATAALIISGVILLLWAASFFAKFTTHKA
jgi:hypothetical protein